MDLTVSIFERKVGRQLEWHTVGLGQHGTAVSGPTKGKVSMRLNQALRKSFARLWPRDLEPLEFVRGRKLQLVTLRLKLSENRKQTLRVPLVVEPRTRGRAAASEATAQEGAVHKVLLVVYHPLRQREYFLHDPDKDLAEEAALFFSEAWLDFDDDVVQRLKAGGKERLTVAALRVTPRALTDLLEKDKDDGRAKLGQRRKGRAGILHELGEDMTARATDGRLDSGVPRSPYRQQLAQMCGGKEKRSVLLVGPSGAGKSMILARLTADLLEADGYAVHRNIDKVRHVWQIRGRRIIAGMSYLGQWEQRCVELLDAVRDHKGVLWVDDIEAWGRIGESRESERSLSTFFRGPVARREIAIWGECTAEQFERLRDDAPAFATAFTVIRVDEPDSDETTRLMVQTGRRLEIEFGVRFTPDAYVAVRELGGALAPGLANPGKSIDLLRSLAKGEHFRGGWMAEIDQAIADGQKIKAIKIYRANTGVGLRQAKDAVEGYMRKGRFAGGVPTRSEVPSLGSSVVGTHGLSLPAHTSQSVISLLALRTGMPSQLIDPKQTLEHEVVERRFAGQIRGQSAAVELATDLVMRLKSGLTDPGRPYGVFLFTGPTGTGKTEMAKCIAEYLYGSTSRLIRFDMSEFNGPDAPSRLVGDRWQPEGVLTGKVRTQPFCVVLFDEIEKAHGSVLNLMLQLFDDGRLGDGSGTLVDFRHTVLIMTSNLGSKHNPSLGFGEDPDASSTDVMAAVREFFPPELFNRIDRVVEYGALDRSAARSIARASITGLLDRRGLTERGIFVHYTEAVLDWVVDQGFSPRDGARSLKRFLEDRVGAKLADDIAGSHAAEIRVFWLFMRAGMLEIHRESLVEARAVGVDPGLEELMELSMDRLVKVLPSALERVEALLESGAFAKIDETLSVAVRESLADAGEADRAFHLEQLRNEVLALRERLRTQVDYDPRLGDERDLESWAEFEGEIAEATEFSQEEKVLGKKGEGESGVVRFRALDGRAQNPWLPLSSRQAILDQLAELYFLESALDRAADPAEHSILLELTRVSRSSAANRFAAQDPGLLEWLVEAYATARGTIDAGVFVASDGRTSELNVQRSDPKFLATQLDALTSLANRRVILGLTGPSVRTFLAGEHGSHIRHSFGGETEVVRVCVLPQDRAPMRHLQALSQRREAFERALEHGAALPDNPDAVLPIVRAYRLDGAPAGTGPGPMREMMIEDYVLAHATQTRARSLTDLLRSLWMLRLGARNLETLDAEVPDA